MSSCRAGRVCTDRREGFLLDRDFQVLQTWYPEARRFLGYGRVDLRPFYPGALVRVGGHTQRLSDVWRRPARLPEMLVSPVGTLGDKLRLTGLRRRSLSGDLEALYGRPETTARQMVRERRFSDRIVERFFIPFFSGVFFDPVLRPGPCTPGRPRPAAGAWGSSGHLSRHDVQARRCLEEAVR